MDEKKKETLSIVQVIEKALSQFSSRLDRFEGRLEQLEANQSGNNPILDERRIPAETGELGGRILSSSPTGAVQRDIMVTFCDVCGSRVQEENLALCPSCKRKVCVDKCLVEFDGEFLCVECLKEELPLSKKHFKVLLAIANENIRVSEIEKATRVTKDDIGAILSDLLDLDLVMKKGISIASRLIITHDGLEAVKAYRSVYDMDENSPHSVDFFEGNVAEEVR